ncbi:hypothetical protein [Demequina muriae]|uniref:DUF4190 domain-containing protein n=1 Tax=Demequina muriae TaxID=3051664 RepID=A0ABT8GGS5_9MICO|nr:hypothetical protein [Demequina sp. EGI L300058]MDN4480632.1 hypothetical protein [Demequina sp. EGI L300058]
MSITREPTMPVSDGRDEPPQENTPADQPPTRLSPYMAASPVTSAPTPASPDGDSETPGVSSAETPATGASAGEEADAVATPPTRASADEPDEDATQLLDPVDDQPTEVMHEVPAPEPDIVAVTADAPPSRESDHDDEPDGPDPAEERTPTTDRTWMGVTSFITGALLLSVVAIVLGHLGLTAAKRGRANYRSFSIAGLILGYVGLVVTAVGVWFLVAAPVDPADVDVQAQQDVSAVGAAAATLAVQTGELPEVTQTDDGYVVGGDEIPAQLTTARDLGIAGSGPAEWCLEIAYEGGEVSAFSYTATAGMAPGPCPSSA